MLEKIFLFDYYNDHLALTQNAISITHCLFLSGHVCVHNLTRTYCQMHPKDMYSQHLDHLSCLAKWLNDRLWSKWLWVRVQLQSLTISIPMKSFLNYFTSRLTLLNIFKNVEILCFAYYCNFIEMKLKFPCVT